MYVCMYVCVLQGETSDVLAGTVGGVVYALVSCPLEGGVNHVCVAVVVFYISLCLDCN